MSELGQMLKKARLEQSISLEQLQETTKIRKRYLECIEEGDYKTLPGTFYVRAFIKSYAEAVGLDPAEVLTMYRNVIPEVNNEAAVSEGIAPKRTVTKRSDKWSRFATGVMLVSFFLLIIGLIYYFALRNHNENNQSVTGNDNLPLTDRVATHTPDEGTPGSSGNVEAKAATPTPETAKPELTFLRTDKGIDFYQITHVAAMNVEMTLVGSDCWFQIDKLTANGDAYTHEMLEQGNLAKLGSPRKWESDKPVYLNIGLPKAIELKVNDVVLPLGEISNPKRIQIEASKP